MLQKAIYILILISTFISASANDPRSERKLIVGQSIITLDNARDINHAKNTKIRIELMQEAAFDAIEKSQFVEIDRKVTNLKIPKKNIEGFEKGLDNHIKEAIKGYRIHWSRVSEYEFTELGNKKWHCEVSGYVWQSSTIDRSTARTRTIGSVDRRKHLNPQYKIIRRSVNTVHINANRSELGRNKKLTLVDPNLPAGSRKNSKDKGYIYITKSYSDYSTGKIVKGFYKVGEGDIVESHYFNEARSGFRYEYSVMPNTELKFSDLGGYKFNFKPNNAVGTQSAELHTLMYTTHNLRTNTRWDIGLDVIHTTIHRPHTKLVEGVPTTFSQDTSAIKGIPKFSFGYYIPIIPELLYVTPHAGLGYMLMFRQSTFFQRSEEPKKMNLLMDFGATATLRLGRLDLVAGVRYRYLVDFPQFTNTYPFVGITYSMSRM